MLEFQKFNKIPRLSRDIVITEKIDGTNGQIYIIKEDDLMVDYDGDRRYLVDHEFIDKYCLYNDSDLYMFAGSKTRWLDCSSNGDNYGFAKWVKVAAEELLKLGEGRHYGEWWGRGIQRGYGLDEKRFSLFNAGRWLEYYDEHEAETKEKCPECCSVVPILYNGPLYLQDYYAPNEFIGYLKTNGSVAAPLFMNPEGIIIYHTASGKLFKKTILNDEKPKGNNDS